MYSSSEWSDCGKKNLHPSDDGETTVQCIMVDSNDRVSKVPRFRFSEGDSFQR